MKKFITAVLTFVSLCALQQLFATDHNLYPVDYWKIENYCTEPVHVTITNSKGQVEVEKLLLAYETYTQKMAFQQKQGEALRNSTITAIRPNSHVPIDFQFGGSFSGGIGTITIRIPYFHYNHNLDTSECMNKVLLDMM